MMTPGDRNSRRYSSQESVASDTRERVTHSEPRVVESLMSRLRLDTNNRAHSESSLNISSGDDVVEMSSNNVTTTSGASNRPRYAFPCSISFLSQCQD